VTAALTGFDLVRPASDRNFHRAIFSERTSSIPRAFNCSSAPAWQTSCGFASKPRLSGTAGDTGLNCWVDLRVGTTSLSAARLGEAEPKPIPSRVQRRPAWAGQVAGRSVGASFRRKPRMRV
jgi:hypothetical protein